MSEIAKKYSGGGHKKAAGFRLPGNFVIDDLFDKPARAKKKVIRRKTPKADPKTTKGGEGKE